MRILDANVILRYLLNDIPDQAEEARKAVMEGAATTTEVLAEVVYAKGSDGTLKPSVSMGVGINVNSSGTDYAQLVRPITTLKDIYGKKVNREKLLQMLIASLERAMGQFRAFGIRPWVEAWRRMDQFIGARGTIIENSVKKSGTILDMQNDGSLLFKCDDGSVETVYSADLEI